MLGTLELPPSSPEWGGEGERIPEIICFPVPFREELGNGPGDVPSHRPHVGTAGRGTQGYQTSQLPVSNLLKCALEEAWGHLAQLCLSPSYARNPASSYPRSALPWSFYKFLF